MLFPSIEQYIKDAEQGFEGIAQVRKQTLSKISQYVAGKIRAGETAALVYICTHNSRRSHFGQLWAQTAASWYGYENVTTYSGGTEATAFNPNAIRAVERVGFQIENDGKKINPHYTIRFQDVGVAVVCCSKKYDDLANPQEEFCAIMTCTEADGACPFVAGAVARVATPYDDPKAFDNTELQDTIYSERCKQIATETLYAFSLIKNLL